MLLLYKAFFFCFFFCFFLLMAKSVWAQNITVSICGFIGAVYGFYLQHQYKESLKRERIAQVKADIMQEKENAKK